MEDDKKSLTKRLVIDLSTEEHVEIKTRAALRNITIKKWVMRAIMEALKKEKQYE